MKVRELVILLQAQDPEAEVLMEDVNQALNLADDYWESERDGDFLATDEFAARVFMENQAVTALEAGYTDGTMSYHGIPTDLPFTLAETIPASLGAPAVRLLGSCTPKTNPRVVRRELTPGSTTTGVYDETAAASDERDRAALEASTVTLPDGSRWLMQGEADS